jgi:hypothetical protein
MDKKTKVIKESTLQVLRDDAKEANDAMLVRQLDQIEKDMDQKVAQALATGLIVGASAAIAGMVISQWAFNRIANNQAE